ncbi:hypothetical protein A1Q1_08262 [Trichosporon asahii var. asahii CBS 2479]|uniref:Peroxidase n=1 Tax=Trichosporon asahii var. asahii (strain ATCC 90039 / CBS 2479 / JCM 2466 / KCTC 7840 / NBRC 103889/ NCYC 2677 / UAMH 7654) TaxID=1186058 RepID=J4UGT6_TRIAS|nr:hypothetical protein A1Q1_08262 [Trichosporon asahii var. asahii CBS 2479]EJT50710.1 hypothetical protein A1Q1_08262 [Trichosporon asahii var. asahii CBS 2479]
MLVAGILFSLLSTLATVTQASDADKLRRLMVDSRFLQIVTPCKTGGTNRNNAAEWLRTAFHDAVDHDAAAGTGGVDGSIDYELDFEENKGIAFPSVMTQYKFYQQEDVSLSDIIALGAIVAVGACGGPMIPMYHGRQDVFQNGGTGRLPLPEGSTESHIEIFKRMGFTTEEMIGLVACGHTLGGVHANINGHITSQPYHHFDTTVDGFDNSIAKGHIEDTRVNPIGQPWDPNNPAVSSDTRTFAADGNVTMRGFAESQDKFFNTCADLLERMVNLAPSSVSLQGPLEPFPISATFWPQMRNGAYSFLTGSARLYNLKGQWSSFDITYTNRDGSAGTDASLLSVKDVQEMSIGKPIEYRNFNMGTRSVPPESGIGSVVINVRMNDGSTRQEVVELDDTIMVDIGNQYTCKYTGAENNNANGLNVSMAVLAPYNDEDKVEVRYKSSSGEHTLAASYIGARDATYNIYNVFIPDMDAIGLTKFGGFLTRADGSTHKDTKDDVWYRTNTLGKCVAGATIPTAVPTPSAALARRAAAKKTAPASPCSAGAGWAYCNDRCVNILSDIEHCGGCSDAGGVDCGSLTDGDVQCIQGKCVVAY